MCNFSGTDRMIFLNRIESDTVDPSYMSPLTTVFYPDDQISSYQHTISSTTPMSSERLTKNLTTTPQLLIESVSTAITWHPANHKRHYSTVYRHNNELESSSDSIKKSILKTISPQKRMFLPDSDEFEYVDSKLDVSNIQDILGQNGNDHENENRNDASAFVLPSMPFSRTMKVEGIYRREKKKRDHLTAIGTDQSGSVKSVFEDGVQVRDPFSKFKPSKPSDVNLLIGNMMKHKHYTHHKPRPLTTPTTLNNYYEDFYGSQDPNIIYNQIIAANNKNRDASIRNGRYEKPTKSNKPFSLMLDVYPMSEETIFDGSQAPISTRIAPYTPHIPFRRPFYAVNSQAINHNLHYTKENSFYNQLKFPQIQQYQYSRTPHVMGRKQNDGYYPNFITQRMNSNVFRPILKPSPPLPIDLATEEGPSQITVHLNLYPDRKKHQTRNVEILSASSTTPTPLKDDTLLWKRLEHRENATSAQPFDVHPSRNPYIPPFNAIKINSLGGAFDLNDTNLSLQSTDQAEKSVEYDVVEFDSKRLIPNVKPVHIFPTANSVISTSSPYLNDALPTISTEIPSTLPSHFDSTVSSSIFTSPTADHFPYISTNIPFETTAVTDAWNESESDQVTTTYNNKIRFPDQ